MADPRRAMAGADAPAPRSASALAVDDFGTGYSSLAHLKRLPVDELKIDKSFVHATWRRRRGRRAIVRSTIELAHNLGLRVVAEGVETRTPGARCAALGCDLAQGFLISRRCRRDQGVAGPARHRGRRRGPTSLAGLTLG